MNALQRDLKKLVPLVESLGKETVAADPHRQRFHLQPPVGWLNDPNGLCVYSGQYHAFFQYGPFDVNGGVKHWGHAVSTDLLHWEQLPVMLYPDEPFDCHGAYSGSALVEDGTMYLYYTGNVKHPGNFDYIKEGRGHNVCLAISKDGVTLDSKQCLLTNRDYPAGLTCHVRDPKVFAYEGRYYMVLGARTLEEDGNRTFSFYRKPSADLLYAPEQIDLAWFRDAFALHFCSVSLVDSPMRHAHLAAISAAREAGAIVSFDPNLRFPLWPDRDMLRETVLQFMPLANILKISDEELEFLTGTADIEAALPQLFVGDVQLVLYTCGSEGAHAYTRTAHGFAPCQKVKAVDTTGAGDGFIGSFLWQLSRDGVTLEKLAKLSKTKLNEYLAFSNKFCGISVQQHGAIDSYPTLDKLL